MRFELKEVSICAEKEFELIRITDPVREFVAQTGVKNGVVYVITEHTTTGIMVNESLPCVEKDIMETLDRIAPENCSPSLSNITTYSFIYQNLPSATATCISALITLSVLRAFHLRTTLRSLRARQCNH